MRSSSSAACCRLKTPHVAMTRRSVRTNHLRLHGIQRKKSHSASATAAIRSAPAMTSFVVVSGAEARVPEKYSAAMTNTMSRITSGSQRKSGRVATITRSFGSRITPPGAFAIAAILGRGALRRRGLGSTRCRAHELLEQVERLAWHDALDAAQRVLRALAVIGDLALDDGADIELVEDGAEALDVLHG